MLNQRSEGMPLSGGGNPAESLAPLVRYGAWAYRERRVPRTESLQAFWCGAEHMDVPERSREFRSKIVVLLRVSCSDDFAQFLHSILLHPLYHPLFDLLVYSIPLAVNRGAHAHQRRACHHDLRCILPCRYPSHAEDRNL